MCAAANMQFVVVENSIAQCLCLFPQSHLFRGSNTTYANMMLQMLGSFRSINLSPTGGLASFVDGTDSMLRLTFGSGYPIYIFKD